MNTERQALLGVCASAVCAAAVEAAVVAGVRRLRFGSDWRSSYSQPESRGSRLAHAMLAEILATLQAELIDRRRRASHAIEHALDDKRFAAGPVVPAQRTASDSSSPATASVRRSPAK